MVAGVEPDATPNALLLERDGLSLDERGDDAFGQFAANASFGIYRSSLDGKQLRANPALARLNGYASEREMPDAVSDIAQEWYATPGRRAQFEALLARDGRVDNFESEVYRRHTRERIWISENAWLVRDALEKPLCYEGTVEEITARKRAETRLTELVAFQGALLKFVEDGLESGFDERFFQRLLEQAVRAVPEAQAGSILLQDSSGLFRYAAAVNFDLEELKRVVLQPDELFIDLGRKTTQFIRAHRAARAVLDERRPILERAGRIGELKASLATPIYVGSDAVAYLSLNNFESETAFSEDAAEMSTIFAKQVGVLLQRLRLEQQLRERQERLERWGTFRAGLLTFMQETLQRGFDDSFYQRLLEYAVAAIPGADAGSILLRDERGRYGFAAAIGYDLARLQEVSFGPEELLDNIVTGEVSVIDDLAERSARVVQGERYGILRRAGRLEDIQTFLSLPVFVQGEVLATLNLDAFKPGAFGEEALEMARTFAAQIGILLQRLKLERQLAESNALLEKLANYDLLTGLPNRALLRERLGQAFARAQRANHGVGLLFLDLDGFKLINDSLGHQAGDRLLVRVAERLRGCVREGDTVARLGGDEFTFVVEPLQAPEDAAGVAGQVLEALQAPFELGGRSLHVTGSIGISCYPEDGKSAEELLQHADTAMYQAKAQGKSYRFFTPSMNAAVLERLQLEADLREALAQGDIYLAYQPRVQLSSGQVTGFEALARWRHPQRGEVPPSLFIPVAEQAGLIGSLGAQLLGRACLQAACWREAGLSARLAVNLSVKQLHDPGIVATVRGALAESGLEPERLELEITESAAMTDVERSIATLSDLRDLGVRLAIDDFGTGYSSLNYLKRLPIGSLKIDRSFVQGLDSTLSHDSAIVGAIVALGKSLGYQLVAEGVETREQLRILRQFGCHEAQGYLFSKPLPPDEALRWAANTHW